MQEHKNDDIDVASHIPLITFLIKQQNIIPPIGWDYDDLVQQGTIGLLKAKKYFNPDYGVQFSTFAGKCIMNEFFMMIRKEKNHSTHFNHAIRFEAEIRETDGLFIHEVIEDVETTETRAGFNMIEDYLDSETLRFIYRMFYVQGYTQREIATEVGVNQSLVSKACGHIKKQVKRGYEGEKPEKKGKGGRRHSTFKVYLKRRERVLSGAQTVGDMPQMREQRRYFLPTVI